MSTGRQRSRILIPVDFSEASGKALRHAGEWAERTGSDLDVVHVLEVRGYAASGASANLNAFVEMLERHARAELGTLVAFDGEPVTVRYHVALGEPASAILDLAGRFTAVLVIVGATGAGKSGMPLGSVARTVVERAACPVLVMTGWQPHHGPRSHETESSQVLGGSSQGW